MQVQDVYRAQYFIACLEKEIRRAEKSLTHITCFSGSLYELLTEFSTNLLIELDQLLLPTIVHEIHEVKSLGFLKGETSANRYVSFFTNDNGYTEHAKNLVTKYPLLFELTDNLIRQTFDSLILCLSRYWNDIDEISQWLREFSETNIEKVVPLSSSDRHRNQQPILICFSCGKKLIYKPVDLSADHLFSTFVTNLEMEVPYNLKTLNVLPKDSYGWMEFVHPEACNTLLEVKNFYYRAGVLLAIADALNYTDGHYENLIAHGEFPILIDNETFFQNYERPVAQQKNILSTLLIQKADNSLYLNSAFQAPNGIKLEYLQTHAINDHTDEIEIRYFGMNPSKHHHCPILKDAPCYAKDYVQEIVDGYSYAYDKISYKVDEIIQDSRWWKQVGNVQSRIVIRETMTYAYLIRKISQPENLSKRASEIFLQQKLGNTTYTDYEVSDLLSLNIPYFFHLPGERHLYDGRGHRYDNAFKETAIEVMKQHFKQRSEEKKRFDCEIIARHLTSPQFFF